MFRCAQRAESEGESGIADGMEDEGERGACAQQKKAVRHRLRSPRSLSRKWGKQMRASGLSQHTSRPASDSSSLVLRAFQLPHCTR